jgi:DUF971 family protein
VTCSRSNAIERYVDGVVTAAVIDVQIERERAMTVEFDDGVICEFPLGELRKACPCASCRQPREPGRRAPVGLQLASSVTVASAELVGAWGISITWSDGHSTGIYPWASLRRWYDGETAGITDEAPWGEEVEQ